MNKDNVYIVILAGGKGERLWPLSRTRKPKQLLSLYRNKTLLELTIERVQELVPRNNLWVMTTKQYEDDIQKTIGDSVGTLFSEPSTQNTGPAIIYTCLALQKINPQATVIFLPADHYIPDKKAFHTALEKAVQFAQKSNQIVLLGNRPTFPATGYGYIEYAANTKKSDLFSVTKFHEKPNAQTAEQYINQKNMLWNGGMFTGHVATFVEQCKQHAPDLYTEVANFIEKNSPYADITPVSIDHAIMERSKKIAVLPVDFTWSDIGNLKVFLELKHQLEQQKSQVVSFNAQNNSIEAPNKLVALLDVDNLCIVETDDVLLIGKQGSVEQVKKLLTQLKEDDTLHKYL